MGELARMPSAPKLAESPLELMTPRPGEGFTPAQIFVWPMGGIGLGAALAMGLNYYSKKPMWAGIYRHIIFGAAGWYLMTAIRDVRYAAKAESDAAIKHYISLHPEDFPPYERKRWSEVYRPFNPAR